MKFSAVIALAVCFLAVFCRAADTAGQNRTASKRLISEICALDGQITSCSVLISTGKRDEVSGVTVPLTRADTQAVVGRKNKLIILMKAKVDSLGACYRKPI